MDNWEPNDNTNFTEFIRHKFDKYKITGTSVNKFSFDSSEKTRLNSYQKLLENYINDDTPYRGVLINHGLGSGKTLSSIAIAEATDRKVIVMLPAALKQNYIDDLLKHVDRYTLPDNYNKMSKKDKKAAERQLLREINKKYRFVSLNAWNSASTLENADGEDDVDRLMGNELLKDGVFKKKNALDNKLLIIDEVHNLLVNITNADSKNGIKIFHQIMNARNLKLIFLSGTPVIKDPYELAVMFNMLRGYLVIPGKKEKYTVFPSEYNVFVKYFVDRNKNEIINKNVFQERINGLVSFYSGVVEDPKREILPQQNDTIVKNVEMSPHQWKDYISYRKEEADKERISKHKVSEVKKTAFKRPGKGSTTTHRVMSRQVSNFALPEDFKRPQWKKGEKMDEIYKRLIAKMTEEHLVKNLQKHSPKMAEILKTIEMYKKGIDLVYSDFKNLGGIGVFARVLKLNGWHNFNDDQSSKGKTFAIFSGDTPDDIRSLIKQTLNTEKNKHGDDIRVLMITGAGAEGLDLKSIRRVHIMEPYWNRTRTDQVIGRGVRLGSHSWLPVNEREVDVYFYLSVPPGGDQSLNAKLIDKNEKFTTDVSIYNMALRRQELLDKFLDAMREIAIDCSTNFKHNLTKVKSCKVCVPNNKTMWYPNLRTHILSGVNCIDKKSSSKQKFQTVKIGTKEYKYDPEKKRVYKILKADGITQLVYDANATKKYLAKKKK